MTSSGQLARRLLFALFAAALGLLAIHALTGFGNASVDGFFTKGWYNGIEVAGVVVIATRAALMTNHRRAWGLIAAAFACWTAGDIVWAIIPDAGYPSPADGPYLAFYPLALAGMALLLSDDRRHIATKLWLDGLIAALAVVALVAALMFDPIVHGLHSAPTQIATDLAYPIADLILIGVVLTAFATQAWRPSRGWVLLGLGVALSALVDTIFLYQDAIGTYRSGSIVDVLWPTSLLCCAWAAWQPWTPPTRRNALGRQLFAFPAAFTLLALGLLVYGQFARLSDIAAVLATAALLGATARAAWTFRENVLLLRRARREALTDGLTGLPNRRSLIRDLDRAVAHLDRPSTLAFFDLDGFKTYNDGFGHGAGDRLLDRLATRLAQAVAGHGIAYRLGGDEFCVLLGGPYSSDGEVIAACRQALSEQGDGFRVSTSCGVVAIPDEASNARHALQLADQRMYADKDCTRTSSRRQTRDVLMQVLGERDPDLHDHMQGVATLAIAVGRQLSFDAEQLDEVARAAELHDIGKVAIPDEILHKPGPLSPEEWGLMHQHTVTGERILAAAPAMRPVAAIVRASHERYDGRGYPDGLAGEEIPLGARVVAVCDAYHAMTSDRAYQPRLDGSTALAELHRCAGTQFDPAIVEAFTVVLRTHAQERDAAQGVRS